MAIGRQTRRTWGARAAVVLAAATLVVGGCDRRRRSEPVDRSTTTTAAELEQTTEGEASPTAGVIMTIDLDDGAAAGSTADAGGAQATDEEPRGADRYSVIATPDLERNLGLAGDGGRATATGAAPEAQPAAEPAEEETRPEPRRPSAADRVPWPRTTP